MEYEPQIWETGHRITAEKMNHIEQGIANSSGGTDLVVLHMGEEHIVETVDEVVTAMQSDAVVMLVGSFSEGDSTRKNLAFVTQYINSEPQVIEVTALDATTSRFAAEPDGYFYFNEG